MLVCLYAIESPKRLKHVKRLKRLKTVSHIIYMYTGTPGVPLVIDVPAHRPFAIVDERDPLRGPGVQAEHQALELRAIVVALEARQDVGKAFPVVRPQDRGVEVRRIIGHGLIWQGNDNNNIYI